MLSKKGNITINHVILIVLGLLVLLAVLMFIFKANILEWLRNLPEYDYGDPEVGDLGLDEEAISSICKGANYVGFVGKFDSTELNNNPITFFRKNRETNRIYGVSTKLYWKGGGKNGEIYLKIEDFSIFGKTFTADWFLKDLLIAKSDNNGRIYVEDNLLNYDSEFYQTTRFSGKRPPEITVVPELEAAYFVDGNKLCREGKPASIVPAWPEPEGQIINLDLRMYVDPETGKVVTQLDDYFELGEDIRFLYLVNAKDSISIVGLFKNTNQKMILPLKIYPDGSVWFFSSMPENYFKIKDPGVITRKNEYLGKSYLETNLRVNYDETRRLIDAANRDGFTEPEWSDSQFNENCPFKAAKILKDGEILLSVDYCKRASPSGLVFDGFPEKGEIKLGRSIFGEIKDNKVTLNQGLIDKSGDLYKEAIYGKISDMCILNLQDSEFISGYLCRSKVIIPGYSGTDIYKTITIDSKTIRVKLTYQDDSGVCRVVEGPIAWLESYGMRNGELLYFNDGSWNNAEVLSNEQIKEITYLREEFNTIVEKKRALKTESNLQIGFKSTSGLYFNEGARFYYFPSNILQRPVFMSALSKQELYLADKGTETSHYYILTRLVTNPFVPNPIVYGIDANFEENAEKNVLYSYDSETKSWNKFDSGVYNYIYTLESDWNHVILRENVREELTNVCK